MPFEQMKRLPICCRRGCAPKLWQRRALGMLASLILLPPLVSGACTHHQHDHKTGLSKQLGQLHPSLLLGGSLSAEA